MVFTKQSSQKLILKKVFDYETLMPLLAGLILLVFFGAIGLAGVPLALFLFFGLIIVCCLFGSTVNLVDNLITTYTLDKNTQQLTITRLGVVVDTYSLADCSVIVRGRSGRSSPHSPKTIGPQSVILNTVPRRMRAYWQKPGIYFDYISRSKANQLATVIKAYLPSNDE